MPEDIFTEEDAANLRPFYNARNRWRLALLLIQNPSLMRYRKLRLPRTSSAEDTIAEEVLVEDPPTMGGTETEREIIDTTEKYETARPHPKNVKVIVRQSYTPEV